MTNSVSSREKVMCLAGFSESYFEVCFHLKTALHCCHENKIAGGASQIHTRQITVFS